MHRNAHTALAPARPIAPGPRDLVLNVHVQLRLCAGGSELNALGETEVGGGHDLAAELLRGALQALAGSAGGPRGSGAPAGGVFRREGEYWEVSHGDRAVRLRDMKGMRYLARLLADPAREFHALDLIRLEQGPSDLAGPPCEDGHASTLGFGDAGELLDPDAKRAYRRRLATLREELDGMDDPERVAMLRTEIDFLSRELAAAMGLGGRDVKAASAAERARLNVTNRIKAAISKIESHDRRLGRHFDASVRTGIFCSYRPEPDAAIAWTL